MLAVLLLAITGNIKSHELPTRFDLVEVNHYLSDLNKHQYSQLIFWDWDPQFQRFHAQAWDLIEKDELVDIKKTPRGYLVSFTTSQHKRATVVAKHMRETATREDPERENQKLFDTKYRYGEHLINKTPPSTEQQDPTNERENLGQSHPGSHSG